MQQQLPKIIKKHGELTGKELFKVAGQHTWHSTPKEAIRCFEVTSAFWQNYTGDNKDARNNRKERK